MMGTVVATVGVVLGILMIIAAADIYTDRREAKKYERKIRWEHEKIEKSVKNLKGYCGKREACEDHCRFWDYENKQCKLQVSAPVDWE